MSGEMVRGYAHVIVVRVTGRVTVAFVRLFVIAFVRLCVCVRGVIVDQIALLEEC